MLLAFQKRIVHGKHTYGPGQFSKVLINAPINILSNRSEGFEFACFERPQQNSKAFSTAI
jgi:hypothetical protein